MIASQHQDGAGQRQSESGDHGGRQYWFERIHLTDWLLVIFNFVLAVTTVFLYRATRTAADAAKNSADAALLQTTIMAAAEAPIVRATNIRIGGMGLKERDGRPKIPDIPFLVVDFVNGGKSPATVVAWGFDKLVRNGLPPEVREAEPINILTEIYLMAGDKHETHQQFDLSATERKHIMPGFEHLWIWGFVDFVDKLGKSHRQRFFVQAKQDPMSDNLLFSLRPLRPPPLIA